MNLLFLSRSQQEKGWEGGPMAPAPALVLVRRHCRHLALEVVCGIGFGGLRDEVPFIS